MDELHQKLLKLILLSEPGILANLCGETTIKDVEICSDGTIVIFFKQTPKWIQTLFNMSKKMSLTEVATLTAKQIVGMNTKSFGWTDQKYKEFMSLLLENGLLKGDFNLVVDILFDTIRLSTCRLGSKYLTTADIKSQSTADGVENDIFVGVRFPSGSVIPARIGKIKF